MTDILAGLGHGFSVAFQPENLLFVLIGVTVGTLIGLIPGLGPVATIALLLPLTFSLDPAGAVMMLAGIYYGSMYGGRIPAILLRLPGDASAVVTTFDGYPLAQQGRAGPALGITAIGSFLGGTVAIIGLSFLAPTLAGVAKSVGSPDMFVLAAMGLLMIVFLGSGSKVKAIVSAALGVIVATVGLDPTTADPRLTYGSFELTAGVSIVAVAVGLFGIGEILYNAQQGFYGGLARSAIGRVLPTRADWLMTRMAILRSSIIGFFIGIIPGGGGTISAVVAYGAERRFSRHPEKFGKGAMDGLAATETADNSSSNSSFLPLLTLGVPPNPVLALIFGALLLHNITPGPQLIDEYPDVFWGVIASMYVGNILLLILNLPLIGLFVRLLRIPGGIMAPIILMVAVAGVYSVRNSMFDVLLAVIFGIVGYVLRTFNFGLGPFVLGFILGPLLEEHFRRSMVLSDGSFMIFLTRPIPLVLMSLLLAVIIWTVVDSRRKNMRPTIDQFREAERAEGVVAESDSGARPGSEGEPVAEGDTPRHPGTDPRHDA
ncbi:tripartite tricarboxylate transporter permease [Nesterenkonia sp. CL21]|uniref:tripartite tricarboxylate transporter permease n=1 Tax=Nesterenkonia sp. CL21 TaxID=3064894 RepID=UPI0028792194|nr:tripartite tricarboxylate transporter permease [Nesterenkonia sp. CL21]MDS2173522.1 tripartite tricarboxylate transporter permease [Nesterenkonia sp. CL21]